VTSRVREECGTGNRVVAQFVPQIWENDYAIDQDVLAYTFDVTNLVRHLPLKELLAIDDDSYDGDDLWWAHPASSIAPWDGPFKVRVREAISAYVDERLIEAVGEALMWETLARLRPEWAGTIDELILEAERQSA
jgi:hypothetical protein